MSAQEIAPDTGVSVEFQGYLETLLRSPAFAASRRRADLLRYLVDRTLAGQGDSITEYGIGLDVFGKPESFDTRFDSGVRSEVSRLRKMLAQHYEGPGATDAYRIAFPGGGYVPLITPLGIQEAPADLPAPHPPDPPAVQSIGVPKVASVWWIAAAVVVGIAVVTIAIFRYRDAPSPSIAVLPFVNLSADPASGYFSDGLTEELTDSLARIKGLRVVANSSASTFKGKAVNVSDVGRALNVAEVLEGSVERSEDKVKVVAHLVRASDGSILWSNTYVRPASDLFAVQTELATGVSASLSVAAGLPDAASTHVPNPQAHDLVMSAVFDMNQNTPAALKLAEAKLRNAIAIDPAYAAAFYDLALVTFNRGNAGGSTQMVERSSIEPLLRKALELDPGQRGAHAMLGRLAMEFEWDWAGAEREMQLATAGVPDANAEAQYALLLTFRGRFAEADRHAVRAMDLSPLGTATRINVGQVRHLEGRFAQARTVFQQMGEQFPAMVAPQQMLAQIAIEDGHPELALPIVQRLKTQFPRVDSIEASALAKEGRRQEALQLLRPLEEKYPATGIPMQWVALVYASMDDEPNTVKWLERSADRHEPQALNLAVHPAYAALRNSPAFLSLKKRMGLQGVSPQ